MNVALFIYGAIFLVVVIIVLFVVFFKKNTFKAGIWSLLTTLSGFAIGQTIPEITFSASSPVSQSFLGYEVSELYVTTATPLAVTLLLMSIVGVSIITFVVLLYLDNKNKREHGQAA